jgi:hypothetical protein
MINLSFDDYAKGIQRGGLLLDDTQVSVLLTTAMPSSVLALYCARIAVYCTQELRSAGKLPECDDSDYIDAAQECALHVAASGRTWLVNRRGKWSTYYSRVCRNVITDYLWTQYKGGTDYGSGSGYPPSELPDTFHSVEVEEPTEGDSEDTGAYASAPYGMRDPLEEAIAAQEAELALLGLQRPADSAQSTHKRNISVRKLLGVSAASWIDYDK